MCEILWGMYPQLFETDLLSHVLFGTEAKGLTERPAFALSAKSAKVKDFARWFQGDGDEDQTVSTMPVASLYLEY